MSRFFLGLLAALAPLFLAGAGAHASEGPIARTENVSARLISERAAITPGETIHVALWKDIRDNWHTYWRNPGDAGEATVIDWELPDGFSAGEIVWPAPKTIQLAGVLTNYGYEGELILPVAITAPSDLAAGEDVTLHARATWLVCEEICIPEQVDLELTLPVADGPAALGTQGEEVARTVRDAPRPEGFDAGLERVGESVRLTVASESLRDAIASESLRAVHFFPFSGAAIDHNAPQPAAFGERGLAVDLAPGFELRENLAPTPGVLAFEQQVGGAWRARAVEIAADVTPVDIGAFDVGFSASADIDGAREGGAPDAALNAERSLDASDTSATLSLAGLLGVLAAAFLGGLILNLMPCVLPVLSIKALGLMQATPAKARAHGLLFLAGVLATFLAFAGVLLVLQSAGHAAGWGFQLQSPLFVAGLALLMFIIGLNLMGVFEIGSSLQGVGGELASKTGGQGAFFTGMLAVVVATPCTAPFMAGALGVAFAQPPLIALMIFLSLGLGLAAPFVALSFAPGLSAMLPKPGVWMDTLKQFFAFPMFLTAIWLVWVLAQQAGAAGVAAVLLVMAAIAFLIWTLRVSAGQRGLAPSAARVGAWTLLAFSVVSLVGASLLAPPMHGVRASASASGLQEEAWSAARVAELRAEGRPVFVDFTAAWCITCQANKATALRRPAVIEAMTKKGVVFMTADWTNRDEAIRAELATYGRSGVPLYLLFGPEGEAAVLPQLLTPTIVLNALENIG